MSRSICIFSDSSSVARAGAMHLLREGLYDAVRRAGSNYYFVSASRVEHMAGCAGVVGFLGTPETAQLLAALVKKGPPLINVSNSSGVLGWAANVLSDDRAVGRMAADHLWRRGHRSFLVVSHDAMTFAVEREEGFTERIEEQGGEVLRVDIGSEWNSSFLRVDDALDRAWSVLQNVLNQLPMDAGIFGVQDHVVWPVLDLLQTHLPDRVHTTGVIGVDNCGGHLDFDPRWYSKLTSVIPGFAQAGREAMKLFEESARRKVEWKGLEIRCAPTGVVERASTAGMACSDPVLASVLRSMWVDVRAGKAVLLPDIAGKRNLTTRALRERFKALLGRFPSEILLEMRIDWGKALLRDRHLSIAEVAEKCGYSEPSPFTNAFRQCTGMSPREWRKLEGRV